MNNGQNNELMEVSHNEVLIVPRTQDCLNAITIPINNNYSIRNCQHNNKDSSQKYFNDC